MFESLGLDSEAEAAYLHLVRHGPATLHQLARDLGRPARSLTRIVNELRELGLLYTTVQPDDPIVAVPLAMGVDHLISQRQRELERLRHGTQQLVAQIHGSADRARCDVVEILTEREDVIRHTHDLQAAAHERLRLLIRGPDATTALLHDALDRHGTRGLSYQLLYDESSISSTSGPASLSARLGDLAQTRLTSQLPVRLTLVDRTIALVPLEGDGAASEQAAVIRGGALLRALDALFESVWRLATPLTLAANRAGDVPDEQDQALLSLLVGGFTDDAAGARLGMSRRTVARRVQRLMSATGARSRLQLGWWARERRWL